MDELLEQILEEKISFDSDDAFDRKKIAQKMVKLLLSEADISPMLIDAPFGAGKTTFCKKSIALIDSTVKKSSISQRCIYFDAHLADHANEPLLALFSTIISSFPEMEKSTKKTLLDVSKKVLFFVAKVGVNTVLRHTIKQDLDDLADGLSEEAGKVIGDDFNHLLDDIMNESANIERNINTFKQVLSKTTKEQNLIIFIDELDRCRPDFSISLIEIAKHIFDIEGIKFVLLANFSQLEASIKHRYGQQIDAKRYLDKFIKFCFDLPNEMVDSRRGKYNQYTIEYRKASCAHASNLINKSIILNGAPIRAKPCLDFLEQIIIHNVLSLREVETFIRYIEINHQLSKYFPADNFAGLYILAVFIFIFKHDIRKKIETQQADSKEIMNLIGGDLLPSKPDNPTLTEIIASFIFIALSPQSNRTYWAEHRDFFFSGEEDGKKVFYKLFNDEFRKLKLQD